MNIALFGTVFMDVKGFSARRYDPVGRNVGEIKFIHGGVGRNIAENLAILNIPVTFGSTVDQTAVGSEICERLRARGVDISYLKEVPSGGIGMWMAVLDQNGNLAGSISQMPDFRLFEALVDEKGEEMIAAASHAALEIDLDAAIARKVIAIANRLGKPVYGIPGNLEVARRHKEFLSRLDCFICNEIEAAKLFDAPLDTEDVGAVQSGLKKFAEDLRMKMMVVTMGARGAVCYERGSSVWHLPVQPVRMADSTGAGDAFFSGVTAALAQGRRLREAAAFGAKVAAHTIQSAESTCVGFKV